MKVGVVVVVEDKNKNDGEVSPRMMIFVAMTMMGRVNEVLLLLLLADTDLLPPNFYA